MKLYILSSLLLFLSCTEGKSKINTISVSELKAKISKSKIQLVDVRTATEFVEGYINNAELIDVKSDNFEQVAIKKLDKTKPVYVYCKMGGRGVKAAKILQKKGFKVYNLKGGYLEWKTKERLN